MERSKAIAVGSDVRCVSGKIVTTRVTSPTQDAEVTFRFQWASWSEVTTLYTAMKNGTTVSINGESITIAVNGISNVRNQGFSDQFDPSDLIGYDTDLWSGTIKGYRKT